MQKVEIYKTRKLYISIFLFLIICALYTYSHAKNNETKKIQKTTSQHRCTSCFVLYLPLIDTMNQDIISTLESPDDNELLFKPWTMVPQLAYRWNNIMPMFGIGYQGLHQNDSLKGHQAQGILTWSMGVRYYVYHGLLQGETFKGFISGHMYWSHLLQNQDQLATEAAIKEFDYSAYSYELSIGAQHALSPYFHLGTSVGMYSYTYQRKNLQDQSQYKHTWYHSIMKLFIQIEFFSK